MRPSTVHFSPSLSTNPIALAGTYGAKLCLKLVQQGCLPDPGARARYPFGSSVWPARLSVGGYKNFDVLFEL